MAAADPTDPQTWNRYAYVRNYPLMATDPTGMFDAMDFYDMEEEEETEMMNGGLYGPSAGFGGLSSIDLLGVRVVVAQYSFGQEQWMLSEVKPQVSYFDLGDEEISLTWGALSSDQSGFLYRMESINYSIFGFWLPQEGPDPNPTNPNSQQQRKKNPTLITRCVNDAIGQNGLSLSLDVIGFIPGGGVVGALAQVGVGTAGTLNSAAHGDATGTVMGATGTAISAFTPMAEEIGGVAKAVPIIGIPLNVASTGRDLNQAKKDYNACMGGK